MTPFSPLNWFRSPASQASCRTALSCEASLDEAVRQVADELGSAAADLALVFVSSHFASDLPRLLPLLHKRLQSTHWLGAVGGGVIGTDRSGKASEVERNAALSVTLLNLPGAVLQPFAVATDNLPDLDGSSEAWHRWFGLDPNTTRAMLLLVDPGSSGINDLISGRDYGYPAAACIGGIAAPHNAPHGSLLSGDQVVSGAVGLGIGGDWTLDPVVAQGCRPIGPVFAIEQSHRNVLLQLSEGSRRDSPVACLQRVLAELTEDEREMAKDSLFLGVERRDLLIGGNQPSEPGSAFLVRNLIGVDPRNGAVAVAERVRPGQNVQFQLREANASRQEASQLLCAARERAERPPLLGLLFACLGRGSGLFGAADGDVSIARSVMADLPISGAFCNGEIGPLGGSTHLHGYTACWGLLRQAPLSS